MQGHSGFTFGHVLGQLGFTNLFGWLGEVKTKTTVNIQSLDFTPIFWIKDVERTPGFIPGTLVPLGLKNHHFSWGPDQENGSELASAGGIFRIFIIGKWHQMTKKTKLRVSILVVIQHQDSTFGKYGHQPIWFVHFSIFFAIKTSEPFCCCSEVTDFIGGKARVLNDGPLLSKNSRFHDLFFFYQK